MYSADCVVASCPSVCLSVTHQYSVVTAKHILKVSSLLIATPFYSVFQKNWTNFDHT